MFSKIIKFIEYYFQIFKNDDLYRYNFDNILIEQKEAIIARKSLKLKDEKLLSGNEINLYQKELAKYMGVSSDNLFLFYTAHAGLCFLLKHLKIKYPDKSTVIIPGFTCTVVVNAITAAGLTPVFVDIELDTYSLDLNDLKRKIEINKPKILAVILQHLFGLVAKDYEKIVNLCREQKIFIIGDCAPSLGTFYKGKSIGLLEDYTIFSSQASKSINTYTGGILLVNKPTPNLKAEYEKLKYPDPKHLRAILNAYYNQYKLKIINRWLLPFFAMLNRNKFISSIHPSESKDNIVSELKGSILTNNNVYIKKFPNILAKIGLIQLSKLEKFIEIRTKTADYLIKKMGLKITIIPKSRPSFLRIPVIRDQKYKNKVKIEENCLVGNWFPYYYDNCPNAVKMSKILVNYTKLDDYQRKPK